MKKLYLVLSLALLNFFPCFSQLTFQGTIKTGPGNNCVTIYMTSSQSGTQVFNGINITLAIPTTVATGVTATVGTNYLTGIIYTPLAPYSDPNTGLTYFDILGNNFAPFTGEEMNFTAGVEMPVATICFCCSASSTQIQLVDRTAQGGGDNFQSYWYVQTVALADVTNPTQKFYTGSTATAGTDFYGDQFLQTTALITLPLKFLSFTATKTNGGRSSLLEWKTSGEWNVKGYYIQRSGNSRDWSDIDFVPYSASPDDIRSYHYTDQQPQPKNYYRIREEDLDGRSNYTDIRIIIMGENQFSVMLHPVPAKDVLNVSIQTEQSEKVLLQISDVAGRVVISRSVQLSVGSNTEEIGVGNIARGVYFLQVSDGKGCRLVNKFVKE